MLSDANTVTIKVKCGENITLRFLLSPSSGVVELRQQVAKRVKGLKLEDETYSMKYKDEDDHEILIAVDEDLRDYIRECRLKEKTVVPILLVPRTHLEMHKSEVGSHSITISEAGRHDGYAYREHEAPNRNLCAAGGQNPENAEGLTSVPRESIFSWKDGPYTDPNRPNELSDKGQMIRKYFSFPRTDYEESLIRLWRSRPCNFGEPVGEDKTLDLKESDLRALALPVLHDYSQVHNPEDYYVSDSCVEGYFKLLKKRQTQNSGSYIPCGFISPFYSNLVHSYAQNHTTYTDSQRFAKKNELFGKQKVFIPICVNRHWYLLVADCIQKKLLWFDSADGNPKLKDLFVRSVRRDVLCSAMEYTDAGAREFVSKVQNCPIQANGVDCGVYVMMIADCLTCGEELPFVAADMDNIRPKLFLDLYFGRIRHGCMEG